MPEKVLIRDNSVYLAPILLIIFIIPSIVYMRAVEQSDMAKLYWRGSPVVYDFFCYYKTFFLRWLSFFAIGFFLVNKFLYGFKSIWDKKLIPLLVYLFFVFLSSVFSDFSEFAWFGYPDRFEGALSIFSYGLIMYLTYEFSEHMNAKKWLIVSFIIMCVLLNIVGIFQFWKMDIFQTQFGREMILPSQFEQFASKLNFHQPNPVYMTLYQSNFVGTFCAIIFPMFFFAGYLVNNKKLQYFLTGFSVLVFCNWIGADSRAGYLGGVVAFSVGFFLCFKIILKRKLYFIVHGILCILSLFWLLSKPNTILFSRYLNKVPPPVAPPIQSNVEREVINITKPKPLEIHDTFFIFSNEFYTIKFSYQNNQLSLFDPYMPLQIATGQKGLIKVNDPRFIDLEIRILPIVGSNKKVIHVKHGPFEFSIGQVAGKFTLWDIIKNVEIPNVEPPYLFNSDNLIRMGSSRGYIWSRAIPMIPKYFFLGAGPDTFPAIYPQHDYIGKYRAFKTTKIIIEKPHNMFLDIALTTGFISLIAFLTFLFFCFKESIPKLFKDSTHPLFKLNTLMFLGFVGFFTANFFNDSLVSVSTIFWVMLGLSLRVNKEINELKTP